MIIKTMLIIRSNSKDESRTLPEFIINLAVFSICQKPFPTVSNLFYNAVFMLIFVTYPQLSYFKAFILSSYGMNNANQVLHKYKSKSTKKPLVILSAQKKTRRHCNYDVRFILILYSSILEHSPYCYIKSTLYACAQISN